MLNTTNKQGFKFIRVENTDFVEVYYPKATNFSDVPVEVVVVPGLNEKSIIGLSKAVEYSVPWC